MMTTTARTTDPHFTLATIARWRLALWTVAAALLAAPWVAMRFTDEVRWDALDFIAFGAMLFVAGSVVEVVVRLSRRRAIVLGAVAFIGALFLLVWAQLAVGVWS